jgi:SAM-dependent methyltransferase
MPDAGDMVPDDDSWTGERVARWLQQAPQLERQLAPVSGLLFDTAAIEAGERVVDIGCGTGPTTRAAAALAGASGAVTGLDISGAMLAAAAGLVEPGTDDAPIDWLEADAVSWSPAAATYDVAMSRFGVMFFTDPVAALRNIGAAVRPGGRFVAAVWGERPESPLFEVPYQVTVGVRTARGDGVEQLPTDGGPFSWHDRATVTDLLTGAGWHDVAIASHVLSLPFGGGVAPDAAATEAVSFGPTRLALAGVDDATLAAVHEALAAEFAHHLDGAGHVVLDAAVRIVSAVR